MPARLPPPAAGWTPATSSSVTPALHARGEAFPLGLGVLARGGIAAWRHALAALAPIARDTPEVGRRGRPVRESRRRAGPLHRHRWLGRSRRRRHRHEHYRCEQKERRAISD
jgi:hypothetical protein